MDARNRLMRARCDFCGEVITIRNHQKNYPVCRDCRSRIELERKRREYTNRKLQKGDYVVVDDRGGDFRRGAFFRPTEVQFMLDEGFFEPGTVLERLGERYLVRGPVCEGQVMNRRVGDDWV